MISTSLAFMQILQALGPRSGRESLRTIGLASNRVMLLTVAAVAGPRLPALYTPLQRALTEVPRAFPGGKRP